MRLLDEIVHLQPGELVVARRFTRETDFYFQGHFPGDPIVPAVILVEMLAQAGGLAAGAPRTGESQGPIALRVAGLGPFKFPAAARAGDVLEARARVGGADRRPLQDRSEADRPGRTVATGAGHAGADRTVSKYDLGLRRIFYDLRTEGGGPGRDAAALGVGILIGCSPFYGFHLIPRLVRRVAAAPQPPQRCISRRTSRIRWCRRCSWLSEIQVGGLGVPGRISTSCRWRRFAA